MNTVQYRARLLMEYRIVHRVEASQMQRQRVLPSLSACLNPCLVTSDS